MTEALCQNCDDNRLCELCESDMNSFQSDIICTNDDKYFDLEDIDMDLLV
jgi:hypothetical protein